MSIVDPAGTGCERKEGEGKGRNSSGQNVELMNDGQPQIAFRLFDHHFESNESHINAKRFTFPLHDTP